MYKESWGLKRICPCNRIMYYDLGRKDLECPECGKFIEVTTLLRPRRGRKPGTTNSTLLINPTPPKPEKKDKDLFIENLDLNSDNEAIDDDSVLIEDDPDIDPTTNADIQPTEEEKEDL
jgi:hypothetical protein